MSREAIIKKYALQNAILYKGKANPKAVLGKVLSEDAALKKDAGNVLAEIEKVVAEVNAISSEEQKVQLEKLAPEMLEKKEKKKRDELPELKNAEDGKVVTRIPPEPSKYNHIGHALSFLLNYMYAQKYHGKCILRFEDTNPEKSAQEYVTAMKADVLEYLDIKPSEAVYVSDHMKTYYQYAEQLIKDGNAYTCTCPSDRISASRRDMKDCPCRDKDKKVVADEWAARSGPFAERKAL